MRRKKSDKNQRSFFDEEHTADQEVKRGSPKRKAKKRKEALPRSKPTVAKAQQARDEGIQVSADNCGDEWQEEAVAFIGQYLRTHQYLHSDQLWAAGLREPDSMRGIGGAMKKAAANGWMKKVVYENGWHASLPSIRSNMALSAIWESLICVSVTTPKEKEATECCKN